MIGLPHDSWAEYYEAVMEHTYGALYDRLTSCALTEIFRHVEPGARILDLGAGCGRLALPLARHGMWVSAVEPSGAMLAELERRKIRLAGVDPEAADRIELVHAPMEGFVADRSYDLAVCVFTVIAYLLEEDALDLAFRAVADGLGPAGLFLLDVPDQEVFEGFEIESGDLIRDVSIERVHGPLYDYRESTLIRTPEGTERYRDEFRLRRWTQSEVQRSLRHAGFEPAENVSAHFPELGARYLLAPSSPWQK